MFQHFVYMGINEGQLSRWVASKLLEVRLAITCVNAVGYYARSTYVEL